MTGDAFGLVASIDRENVRFALTRLEGNPQPTQMVTWPVVRHTTFTAALEAYLRDALPGSWPRRAAIAIAGVPIGDVVNVSGGHWYLSMSGLETYLRSRPVILNDFAASIFALPQLSEAKLQPVARGRISGEQDRGTIALIGPLQGLGTAGLVRLGNGRATVIQSEAGNSSFGAATDDELLFAREVRQRWGHLAPEHLISEPGLVRALEATTGARLDSSGGSAHRIAMQARSGDVAARRAVDLFIGGLAEYARMVVMTLGSWNGLYFNGALMRSMATELTTPRFRERFEGKDRYKRRLADVPIAVVLEDNLDLLGLAIALRSEEALAMAAVEPQPGGSA